MENNEQHPQKVVIIAGPSFGSALSFMLFGAALGAAGACYLQSQKKQAATEAAGLASAQVEEVKLAHRLARLARRVKALAGHARDAAETVSVFVAPVVKNAIEEGKKVAQLTTEEIRQELERKPDPGGNEPAISADQA